MKLNGPRKMYFLDKTTYSTVQLLKPRSHPNKLYRNMPMPTNLDDETVSTIIKILLKFHEPFKSGSAGSHI